MFRLLNKATIGIRHAIVCPCKLGAIDGRIGNFYANDITSLKLTCTKSRNSETK